ncbi:hypothetical protein [uncultured Ruminococcus sp.]|nr:hypothetical protein [uncultured Ruminococcus sp.]
MKESYERMKLEIIAFASDDVVTTSGGNGRDEYESERATIQIPLL